MLDLFASSRLRESHVEGNTGDHRLPRLIFGQATPLDRTPEVDNFLLGNALEKVLVTFSVQL